MNIINFIQKIPLSFHQTFFSISILFNQFSCRQINVYADNYDPIRRKTFLWTANQVECRSKIYTRYICVTIEFRLCARRHWIRSKKMLFIHQTTSHNRITIQWTNEWVDLSQPMLCLNQWNELNFDGFSTVYQYH